ncbi:ankyrin repeat domain-containing protein SOWAHC [Latimeria chalumnae]|uniref:ankyrin repeat domain-containing protein SOWAHC n=1 Tax=Latimeria chalumnae TaxID=7897 RepID=UPI0003C13CEF|nr:PREDICTED: ankyrin repeat domain-containing protein SOWAHC-like [Latimeria chalumnae]|eukprot:XP_006011757.1 PREDICTED: ankyrin repeat domain-containing protein SOWAHC-like [Latimeria chalumnae]
MATEDFSFSAVVGFLAERGGKVKNVELVEHFKVFLSDPATKAPQRERFKEFVNAVACVRQESGVKYVCLKKKYREQQQGVVVGEAGGDATGAGREGEENGGDSGRGGDGSGEEGAAALLLEKRECLVASNGDDAPAVAAGQHFSPDSVIEPEERGTEAAMDPAFSCPSKLLCVPDVCFGKYANDDTEVVGAEVKPVCSVEWERLKTTAADLPTLHREPPVQSGAIMTDLRKESISVNPQNPTSCVLEKNGALETTNSSFAKPNGEDLTRTAPTLLEASSLTAETEGQFLSVADSKGVGLAKEIREGYPMLSISPQSTKRFDNASREVPAGKDEVTHLTCQNTFLDCAGGDTLLKRESKTCSEICEKRDSSRNQGVSPAQISRRRTSRKGLRRGQVVTEDQQGSRLENGEVQAEAPCPVTTAGSESGGNTPRSNRKNFRELMINSSPQLRRSVAHKISVPVKSESDSTSLTSSIDEDTGSIALDPLEHSWMLSASDGKWECLEELLACDPNLITKKDFVTGLTCLHWAAKHGKQELIALLVSFAKKRDIPVNINTKSSGGYTPLHLAAMHGHAEVVKLLVGAYDADVDIRDYSGKKAWQYLGGSAAEEVKGLICVADECDPESSLSNGGGRWRFSKVLPSNLIAHKLANVSEEDACDSSLVKHKGVNRKSSVSSRMKPKLNKMRFKTQIIHTTASFRESENEELPLKSHMKSRPKSTVFG